MQRPPRDPAEPLLTQFLLWRIVFISLIMVMGTLGLFLWDRFHGETLEMSRTTAVNTLIFFQVFYLFNARTFRTSALSRKALLGNPFVLTAAGSVAVIQIFFTYFPPFQRVFGTASIPAMDWVRLLLFTASVFVLVEIEKAIFRHILKNRRLADVLGLR